MIDANVSQKRDERHTTFFQKNKYLLDDNEQLILKKSFIKQNVMLTEKILVVNQ